MRRSRIYCSAPLADSLANGSAVAIDSRSAHYLQNVLRLGVGDSLILFDGSGQDYNATISTASRKQLEVEIQSLSPDSVAAESPLECTLALGISKGERMDTAIQKAVELGVSHIQPLLTQRVNTNKDPSRLQKKQDHWQAVAISACEQSGRSVVPSVAQVVTLDSWLQDLPATEPGAAMNLIFGVGSKSLVDHCREVTAPSAVRLLVGPEGGLADSEVTAARHCGFASVGLGPRVLRTETAPLVALALLQSGFGDLR